MLRWLVLDPLAVGGLVDEGPEPLLLALATHPESPLPLLDRLRFCSRPVLQRAAWRQRLHQVSSLDDLQDLTLHLPPQVGLLPWRTRWLSLATGDALPRAVTLLACARRNGWWLRALHKHLGERLWLDGLQGAIMLLKGSAAREAAMLELVRAVGAELAPPLMAVFAAARHSAVLSDRYRRLDNFDLAENVLPILQGLDGAAAHLPAGVQKRSDRVGPCAAQDPCRALAVVRGGVGHRVQG